MKIRREFEIKLTKEEELSILRKYAKNYPDVVKILLESPKGHCPFPEDCKKFPCNKLNCNADVCSNGHAYRMS